MIKKIKYIFVLSLFILLLVSCENEEGPIIEPTYTLSFIVDGEIYKSYDLLENDLINYPDDPVKDNYEFIGWFYNDILFDNEKIDINKLNLEAKFKSTAPTSFTVKLYHGDILLDTMGVLENNYLDYSDPILEGFSFIGWYLDNNFNTPFNLSTEKINNDINLYAKFEKMDIYYNVSFYNEDILLDTISVLENSYVDYSNPTLEGYSFIGWYLDSNFNTPFDLSTNKINKDIKLYANFEKIDIYYSVSFYNEDTLLETISVLENSYASFNDPYLIGHNFLGWFFDEELTILFDLTEERIDSDIDLFAKFEVITYEVTLYNGNKVFDTVTVLYNNALPVIDTYIPGYKFINWFKDFSLTNLYNIENIIISDTRLYGKWELDDSPVYHYEGYYSSINGIDNSNELFNALNSLISVTSNKTYGDIRYLLQESDRWVTNPNHSDKLYLIFSDTVRSSASQKFSFVSYALPKWDGGDTWNREHVWPKSKLGNGYLTSNSTRGIAADAHNLRAADTRVNSHKTNNYFLNEEVFYSSSWGENDFGNYNGRFYPGDKHRGDVARIIMYMSVRWLNEAPIERTIDLDILLKWHELDPVDDFERNRNNVIHNYQNNRNPFIDHPELAYRIWAPDKIDSYPYQIEFNFSNKYYFNNIIYM